MFTKHSTTGLAAVLLAAQMQLPTALASPFPTDLAFGNLTVTNYCSFPVYYSYNYTVINGPNQPAQPPSKDRRDGPSGVKEGILSSGNNDSTVLDLLSGDSFSSLSLDLDSTFQHKFGVPLSFNVNNTHEYNVTYKFQGNDDNKLEDYNMIIYGNGTYDNGYKITCPDVVCKGGDKDCFARGSDSFDTMGSCPKPSVLKLDLCAPVFLGN